MLGGNRSIDKNMTRQMQYDGRWEIVKNSEKLEQEKERIWLSQVTNHYDEIIRMKIKWEDEEWAKFKQFFPLFHYLISSSSSS